MKHIFWLEPGCIADRCGPDSEPWDLAEIRQAGITGILSVNDGRGCKPKEFRQMDMVYHCLPLSDNAPPLPGDLEICISTLPQAGHLVSRLLDQGVTILIHCTSGKDRTGMLMAYLLIQRRGLSVKDAMTAVRQVRDIAFTAEGWGQFTYDVLSRLRDDHR